MKKFAIFVLLALLAVIGYQLLLADDAEVSTLKVSELAEQQAQASDTLHAQVITEDDLPPEGTRSLFDHLIKEHGSLPYPFDELLDLVANQDRDGRPATTVLIPNGRSLLKGQANFKHPRLLAVADVRQPASDYAFDQMYRGRLFMGFVEDANEIEVISYNEMAGRFEFQLVKDYGPDLNPQIVYAKRAICSTCHQSGAPIFPVRPWEETNANPGVAELTKGHHADNDNYFGAPLSVPLANPEIVDDMADKGNAIITTQKIWLDGCGAGDAGNSCRRSMLKLALEYLWSPGSFNPSSAAVLEHLQLQSQNWPSEGVRLANGDLANRNPLTEKPLGSPLWLFLKDLFGFSETAASLSEKSVQLGLTEFEKLPPLRVEVDPLMPRPPKAIYGPDSLEGIYGLAQMLSENDLRLLEKHSQYQLEAVKAAVDSEALVSLFEPLPFRRIPLLQALLTELGAERLPDSCCHTTEGMSPPVADGAPPLAISQGSVLEVFETYCFACHRGNPNAKLDFMNGDSEDEVLRRIQETSEITDALDYERFAGTAKDGKLMPPANSRQRARLDAAMDAGENDLQRMQDAMPSLFDF
jgi:hypothetical protein